MSPSPTLNGDVFGANGEAQVGSFGPGHAALWRGTTQSYVDLHPTGLPFASEARAIAGNQQVGVYFGTSHRALLWHGTAASVIDLTPTGAAYADCNATDGVQQGGAVAFPGQNWHAGIWSGSAQSFVDLNPAPNRESFLFGMVPGQQVGMVTAPPGLQHAALWSGTAQSLQDLHPFPSGESALYATIGSVQAGESSVPGGTFRHAGVWFGTAASFLDLHQYLPAGYSGSRATSIVRMSDGSITVGGWAIPVGNSADRRAFIWTSVPSPGGAGLLLLAGPLLARRRR